MSDIESNPLFKNIVESISEAILILNADLNILFANKNFYNLFKVQPEETLGHLIYDIGNQQWDIPELRKLLETILPQQTSFDDYEVDHHFPTIGRRTMRLNARQVEQDSDKVLIILLIIEDITERKQAEIELMDSEEQYRRLFETADDGILLLEKRELKICHANPAISLLLGYSNDELIGKNMKGIGFSDRIVDFQEILQTLEKKGIFHCPNVVVQNKAGQFIETDIYMADRARLVQCNIRDISLPKRTERKMQRRNLMLEGINRILQEALSNITEETLGEICLSVAEGITESKIGFIGEIGTDGLLHDIAISQPGWDACQMINPDDHQRKPLVDLQIHGIYGRVLKDGKGFFTNNPAIHPDRIGLPKGHPPLTAFLGVPLILENQTFGMIAVGNRDHGYSSEEQEALEFLAPVIMGAFLYKRAAEALKESEKRLDTILDSNPDPIVVYDNMGHPQYINPAFSRCFGWSFDELNGMTIPFVPKDQEQTTKLKIKELYESGNPVRFETKRLSKKGKMINVLVSGAILRDLQESNIGLVVNLRDITETKKLEDQFRQSQKMESVGRLAGGVAHDYNNVLSVIIGTAELMIDEVDPTGPLRADLDEILKAANRATNITRQLLAFARKQTIAPKVLDVNEIVESMLKMLKRLIGEDIDLAWLPGADLWPVKMDPTQIDQILANLLVNARDAITGVGKITIETTMLVFNEAYCADHTGFIPGDFVMLAVSDNGCGMDKKILDNVFEPFFTTKKPDKGTGLGLSTVYGIVKQNNGFINIYSEPGKGTTIKVYLQRCEGEAINNQEICIEKIPQGRGETILVVEDDPSILKLAKRMLDDLGYTALTSDTPKEAIRLAEKHRGAIRLLLTDVIMPEMSGRELADSLKSLYPDFKCVFMSGYTSNAIAHHGILEDGLHFVQKPFSKEDLAKTVRKALNENNNADS
ncbi:MAG: PAS domain S-box protein [Proteobacteria bacterium]|nr:PAS domain S-box protein [Pseudomonadota bacterium]MBU1583044.1 PAS domain S-box protein [Pseudomonadota bacterium]MBU2452619.1 PAS domain S-box protein [Pseudomonadota bacterium]MBU2629779.1 PAS domain S-box protein [Pseudomonadota bacterium]